MPNLFVIATALPNVVGRVDYISSPNRQERLLASYDATAELLNGQFWSTLAKESQASFEQYGEKDKKCCEGRELMIQLSNALLDKKSPEEIAKTIADEFEEKLGLKVAVGIHLKHYKHKSDNLHAHVIFPERDFLSEPVVKIAERALFFDADGKRRYKKSEILDENKELLPGCRIVKKGEVYEQRYFGAVNQKYHSKEWLKDIKTNVVLPLRNGKLKGDVEITEYDESSGKLPQQHVGKHYYGKKNYNKELKEKIEAYNRQVRKYNQMVDNGLIGGSRAETLDDLINSINQKKNLTYEERREISNEAYYRIGQMRKLGKKAKDNLYQAQSKAWRNLSAARKHVYIMNDIINQKLGLAGTLIAFLILLIEEHKVKKYQEEYDRLKKDIGEFKEEFYAFKQKNNVEDIDVIKCTKKAEKVLNSAKEYTDLIDQIVAQMSPEQQKKYYKEKWERGDY